MASRRLADPDAVITALEDFDPKAAGPSRPGGFEDRDALVHRHDPIRAAEQGEDRAADPLQGPARVVVQPRPGELEFGRVGGRAVGETGVDGGLLDDLEWRAIPGQRDDPVVARRVGVDRVLGGTDSPRGGRRWRSGPGGPR